MQLVELFSNSVQYTWSRQPSAFSLTGQAQFEINGKKYQVDFGPLSGKDPCVMIEFRQFVYNRDNNDTISSVDVENSGDQYAVFSTVLSVIRQFIDQANPQSICFEAHERSRVKLYDRMVKKLALNWKVDRTKYISSINYRLTNPNWKQ